MFVDLEPVREDPEHEQEDSKTEQHHSTHDANSVPNFSSGRCHEAMEGQAKKEGKVNIKATTEQPQTIGYAHFPSAISESN